MAAAERVLGLGTDIVQIGRIADLLADHRERFLSRCFRSAEIPVADDQTDPALAVAGRWAAKEACLKALGARINDVPYRDIEVLAEPEGWSLRLHGRAAGILAGRGGERLLLSIGDDGIRAVALVVVCGRSEP